MHLLSLFFRAIRSRSRGPISQTRQVGTQGNQGTKRGLVGKVLECGHPAFE